ncbi:protein kinase [Candidatus Obscuribacterales bacterium]|nr:protein kinase [Candidatus Obscuribacterales bacterium]
MTSDLEVPEQLKSRYRDFKLIGSGAMGRVFKATDSILLIDVAIKVLLATRHVRSDSAVRFQQEAKAVSKLQHKNILTVMDFGITDEGEPYLVMEFVDGKPLSTILEERKCLSLAEALNITSQICDGMEHAHKVGVIHRDLKPANIIVLGDDYTTASIRILDFGIAKVETVENDPNSVTPEGGFLGSPQYMSPEQMSAETIDRGSDVYSTGCILFHMLSGAHPFESDSLLALMQAKRTQPAPLVNQRGTHEAVPPAVESVIARSLEIDKSKRFSTMIEFKDALLEAAHVTDSSLDDGAQSRFPLKAGAIVAAVAAFIAIFAFLVFRPAEAPRENVLPVARTQTVFKDNELKQTSRVADLFELKYGGTVWEAKEKIDDSALAQLVSLPIDELRLGSQDRITAKGCEYIARMPKLKVLLMNEASLNDDGLRALARSKNLERLQIDGTGVTDAGIAALASTNIDDLSMERVSLTDEGLKSIGQLKNLRRLLVSGTNITNSGLKYIKHLPIKKLHIEACGITDEGMRNMPGIDIIDPTTKRRQSTLQRIYLGQCGVTIDGFKAIKGAPLENLLLSGSPGITDDCIDFIAKTWPKMTLLIINDTGATKKSIASISSMKNLEELGVASLGLRDEDVVPLLKLPKMRILNISANEITDLTLQRLQLCSTLSKLDLTQCDEISAPMLKKAQRESNVRIICPIQTMESQGSLMDITEFMDKQ